MVPRRVPQPCLIDGCGKDEEAGGLCAGHRWRKKHHLRLDVELRERLPPFERVVEAFKAYLDAEGDREYHAAKARIRAAAKAWLEARRGKSPAPRRAVR